MKRAEMMVAGRVTRMIPARLLIGVSCIVLAAAIAESAPLDSLLVREALGITLPRRTVNRVIPRTPLDPWLTGHRDTPPEEGESVSGFGGKDVLWQRITAGASGWFGSDPAGERYAAVRLARESTGIMLLEAKGNDLVLVNGTLRTGNPYCQKDTYESWEPRFDYSRIPVELQKGHNLLLFRYSRGGLKIRLVAPRKPVMLETTDLTLPDAVVGDTLDAWGSVLVVNAGTLPLKDHLLVCIPSGGREEIVPVPAVPALGLRKIPFRVRTSARAEEGGIPMQLMLLRRDQSGLRVQDTVTITLRVIGRGASRRETFFSAIDGSVQYYAVTPQSAESSPGPPALFLTLHGAGVEAINQASSYEAKKWGVVVAPTNRRPYGFSWEDWGRLDALEVLEIVKKKYGVDEGRVYLTGHSMGGHGTWFMGATYPDQFAAIGPSAGWITFETYRFTNAQEPLSRVQEMLRRAASPSDLFSLVDNYRHFGVYVLHGSVDDNVPLRQSVMMLERLRPIHKDLEFHEQPGAGHWWDASPEPGADCVDWMPLFDFFARHVRPGADRVRTVEFTTANPGISSRDSWLWIDAQERQLAVSTARLHLDPGLNRVVGTTSNVSRLAIQGDLLRPTAPATVELDSQMVRVRAPGSAERIWLARDAGAWRQVGAPAPQLKNAVRYGTFKESFRNRMMLVFGTAGNPQENRWTSERAMYDAEKLWYQGNGSVDVVADTVFDPSADLDRNVILYGNSQTNGRWKDLLPDSPVTVERGDVRLGSTMVTGNDVCCIFVRPRPGSPSASVGVVSGTGIDGMRLANLATYLEPGLGLPDLTVFTSEVMTRGDAGIVLTGFFGSDWSLDRGEFTSGK